MGVLNDTIRSLISRSVTDCDQRPLTMSHSNVTCNANRYIYVRQNNIKTCYLISTHLHMFLVQVYVLKR
jgi:hypothetical protein